MKDMIGSGANTPTNGNSGGDLGKSNGPGSPGGHGGGDDKKSTGDKENDKFRGSLSQAIVTEKPNIKWEDVAGLEAAKQTLKEAILLPVKFPDIFVGIRKPWKGILLYGPPGTGKTFLAKACATQANATFFAISSSDLISKWVGESEKLIKELFKMAQENEPSIIFIDEIDSLVSSRSDNEDESSRRVKTEFLVQMQGVGNKEGKILVLGATNFPWGLDPAMRRRFQKRIYIPLPEAPARYTMLKGALAKQNHALQDHEIQDLARQLEGFSGSDVSTYVKQACYEPLRKTTEATHFKQIPSGQWTACSAGEPGAVQKTMKDFTDPNSLVPPMLQYRDFLKALQRAKPTVGPEDLKKHLDFTRDFGMEG